ncbi:MULTISPECIES: REP-associated tyrosine transposase [unclassified Roseovarius]|uniref:REP-associated tyrosine transposase n=1 Tax=unclassified Roseovarius TaxID=2614913 RepID=UPI00273F2340|nr:transposase [Roseovarius sp. MMSF_3350]
MSHYLRPRVSGATVFFSVNLAERGSHLLVDEIERLRAAVRQTRAERPFHIDAWVVLPDHLHAIWTLPEGDADFSTRWGAIKARFTRSLRDGCRVGFHPTLAQEAGHAVGWNPTLRRSASKRRKGDAGIWQRRFWEHHVRGEADYAALMRYCWMNPVKHGFVAEPEEWAYSSVHRDRADGRYARGCMGVG